jgi:hypothetical protein
LTFLTCNATRAASVKASFTPRFFMAEHSKHRFTVSNNSTKTSSCSPPKKPIATHQDTSTP